MSNKEKLFKEIFSNHKDKIYRLCLGYLGNTVDADDLLQDIFIKIWNNLEGFKNESKISTWIYKISSNTALTYINKRKKYQRHINQELPYDISNMTSNDLHNNDEKLKQLYKIISTLKDVDKIIISLILEGCSYEEISEITGMTINNVGVKVNRIKKGIKKKINTNG